MKPTKEQLKQQERFAHRFASEGVTLVHNSVTSLTVTYTNGNKYHYKDGMLCKLDMANGDQYWYEQNWIRKIIYSSGQIEYRLEGKKISALSNTIALGLKLIATEWYHIKRFFGE